MSQPSTATFNTREDLSLTIREFNHEMNERGYVGHRLMPPLARDEKNGKVPRIPLEQELQDFDTKRNPDGTFKRSRMEWEDDNYDTQSHGLEATLDDEVVARYDDLVDCEQGEGDRIERALLRSFEREIVGYWTNVANYDVSRRHTVTNAWGGGSATPYEDVDNVREAMFLELGAEPNAMFLNRADFRLAINEAQILARITGQTFQDARPGVLNRNEQNLALALDIPEVIVANALRNVGQSRNLQRIWPSGVVVIAKVSDSDDIGTEVALGRSMVWSPFGAIEGDRVGLISESYDEPQRAGSVLRKRGNWKQKVWHVEAARILDIT